MCEIMKNSIPGYPSGTQKGEHVSLFIEESFGYGR